MMESKTSKVLIVDDSAVIRKLLCKIISDSKGFEVVATAADPYIAREKLIKLKPDIMVLDIEMPKMDGISFLEKVMRYFPTKTLIFSSLATGNSKTYFSAIEAGAIEVLPKPTIDLESGLTNYSDHFIEKLNLVKKSKLSIFQKRSKPKEVSKKTSLIQTTSQIIAIASSTGGTEALKTVLPLLPPNIPGTLIVQHMPYNFTEAFARELNRICPFEVIESKGNEKITQGKVYLAPGNLHLEIIRSGAYYYTKLVDKPKLHGVKPAADYLMTSVAKYAGKNAIGVVLTGMGKDGAKGLLAMKEEGSFNFAQNENSSVVYGMPQAAVNIGAIHKSAALDDIAELVSREIVRRNHHIDRTG